MQWFRMIMGHKLLVSALISSLGWFLFWVVMAPVEKDIAHIFNWYTHTHHSMTYNPSLTIPLTHSLVQVLLHEAGVE